MGRTLLVTGGTVFVSRYVAEYFARRGDTVYLLNRNTRPQPPGTRLIACDRAQLGDTLRPYRFDAVLDITAYTPQDVENLLGALEGTPDYIFISSSAVYPEANPQPFSEDQPCGPNAVWGDYGLHKLQAEQVLLQRRPGAYILRPPYLYGPLQNLYREPFVFDCARQGLPFYLPGKGEMPLQFFHVEDLCRLIEVILNTHPAQHILNVGNPETVTVRRWVQLCYEAVGSPLRTIEVPAGHPQRAYFCFHNYAYRLDVARQAALLPGVKPLAEGLRECWAWYSAHPDGVNRKPYFDYIDSQLAGL